MSLSTAHRQPRAASPSNLSNLPKPGSGWHHPRSTHQASRGKRKVTDNRQLEILTKWGIRTLGALAALPGPEVFERLGDRGVQWQAFARGEDARPMVPWVDEVPFEAALELEWPIEGLEPLSFVLARLLEPLGGTAGARRSRRGGAAHVAAAHDQGGAHADAAAAGADARSEDAAHADPARPRNASARRADRHRARVHRADAGPRPAMDAARARATGARAGLDADRAPDGTDGRGTCRRPAAGRYVAAGSVRDVRFQMLRLQINPKQVQIC